MFWTSSTEGGYDVPCGCGANIPYEWLIYIFMFIPIGVLLYIYKRYQVWTLAKEKFIVMIKCILSWLGYTFAQARVIQKPLAGMMHALFSGAFCTCFGCRCGCFITGRWPHIEGAFISVFLFVDILDCSL